MPLGQRYIPGNGIELAPTAALDFCQPGKIPAGNQQIHELQHELHSAEFIGMVHVARWEPARSDLRGQDLETSELGNSSGEIFQLASVQSIFLASQWISVVPKLTLQRVILEYMLQYACFNMLQ